MSNESRNRLHRLLNEGAELTFDEIRRQIAVGDRQARRLITELREQGIRIMERSHHRIKCFYILEEDRLTDLHPVRLAEEQLLALAVAARAAEATLASTPLISALEEANDRILDALARAADVAGSIDLRQEAEYWYFPDAPEVELDAAVFSILRRGMRETTTVEIDYHSSSSGRSLRRVNPYTIVYREGSWLLCAWCHRHSEMRTFAIADIHGARLLDPEVEQGAIFQRDQRFDPELYFRDTFHAVGGDPVEVRLRVEPTHARGFLRKEYHPTQQEEELPDGGLEVSFECAGLHEARSFVLSWGEGVTVLAPDELRRQVRDQAERIVARNG